MTPERSRTINAQIEKARQWAEAIGKGIEVTIYDCGGYSTKPVWGPRPGDKREVHAPCAGHQLHGDTIAPPEDQHPTNQPGIADDVARLISKAADQYRGIDRDYLSPTPQDHAAAEQITANYYLIHRAELPTIPDNAISAGSAAVGRYHFSGPQDRDPAIMRGDLLAIAAWVDHLERHQQAQQAEQAAAQANRIQARRDELAALIAGEAENDPDSKVNYAGMVPTARIAIDRIIELEDQQQ